MWNLNRHTSAFALQQAPKAGQVYICTSTPPFCHRCRLLSLGSYYCCPNISNWFHVVTWGGVEFIHQCHIWSIPCFNTIAWWSKSEVFLHDWASQAWDHPLPARYLQLYSWCDMWGLTLYGKWSFIVRNQACISILPPLSVSYTTGLHPYCVWTVQNYKVGSRCIFYIPRYTYSMLESLPPISCWL